MDKHDGEESGGRTAKQILNDIRSANSEEVLSVSYRYSGYAAPLVFSVNDQVLRDISSELGILCASTMYDYNSHQDIARFSAACYIYSRGYWNSFSDDLIRLYRGECYLPESLKPGERNDRVFVGSLAYLARHCKPSAFESLFSTLFCEISEEYHSLCYHTIRKYDFRQALAEIDCYEP